MSGSNENEDRMLTVAEREMVAQTRPPAVEALARDDIQALGKRLREARDRSRSIASQQQREMRGKSDPRGAAPARDNTGSEGKTEVLVEALKRLTAALRRLNRMTAKGSKQPSVRVDPREVGRVSKATKAAQAKRDR